MKNLIIAFILIFAINASGNDLSSRIKILEKDVENLKIENDSINKILVNWKSNIDNNTRLVEIQQALISNSNDCISNQISSSSNFISIASLILGFFGLFIGGYVTWMQNRSANILKESKQILKEIQYSKIDVENTRKIIDNNAEELYAKVQEKEVEHILKRLERIPEDIEHVFPLLASMDISDKFYDRIKPIIINESIKENFEIDLIESLLVLSCQHFPSLVVKDNEILDLIFNNEENLIERFYIVELNVFMNEFIKHIQTYGLYNSAERIRKFLILINSNESISIFVETLFNSLESKLNRFEFGRIIKDTENIEAIKSEYFKLLILNYKKGNNSENDNLLIEEIE